MYKTYVHIYSNSTNRCILKLQTRTHTYREYNTIIALHTHNKDHTVYILYCHHSVGHRRGSSVLPTLPVVLSYQDSSTD